MTRKISLVIISFSLFIFNCQSLFAQEQALQDAEVLMLKGQYAQAAQKCQRVIAHHHQASRRAKAHYLLGLCQLKENEFKQARQNFEIILRKFSHSNFCDDAVLGIADSYCLARDFQQAGKGYESFIRDFPHSELLALAKMHLEQCKQGNYFLDSNFAVQVGCFKHKGNAERLRDELIHKGYQAYISELPQDGLYHVMVGRLSNRLEAEFLEQKLKSEGYSTKVCP